MSYPNSRRHLNVSSYIQNLNTLPSAEDTAASDAAGLDASWMENDLSLFANNEFFDYDMGRPLDMHQDRKEQHREQEAPPSADHDGLLFLQDLDIPDLHVDAEPFTAPPPPSFDSALDPALAAFAQPIYSARAPASTASPAASTSSPADTRGTKRKASSASVLSTEDASRFAAEEDKRRRNTAASARFRVKKKERERQLEKTAKEMTELVQEQGKRIAELETENKWLKDLLVEKNEKTALELKEEPKA